MSKFTQPGRIKTNIQVFLPPNFVIKCPGYLKATLQRKERDKYRSRRTGTGQDRALTMKTELLLCYEPWNQEEQQQWSSPCIAPEGKVGTSRKSYKDVYFK